MTTMIELDRGTRVWIVVVLISICTLAFFAGWGLGRNELYHEVFMEDIELYPVPVDELPERENDTTTQTRSAHARSD